MLAERGLAEALRALALRAPVHVDLLELPDRRLPEGIEAAAYYVVSEALANVQKHAGAKRVLCGPPYVATYSRSRSRTTAGAARRWPRARDCLG